MKAAVQECDMDAARRAAALPVAAAGAAWSGR